MTPSHFDVIVVGGGPAGASAAYDLAWLGRRVLLLDRHEFPRLKPCVGGLTRKTLLALRYSVVPVIERECASLVAAKHPATGRCLRANDTLCALTVRREFDLFCLRKAQQLGVAFVRIGRIHAIEATTRLVTIRTEASVWTTDYLLGADGVHSSVNRLCGLFPSVIRGLGIEACVPWHEADTSPLRIDFCAVPGGYGWVFPKRHHLNVGLFTRLPGVRLTRERLREYAAHRVGCSTLVEVAGHHVGLNGARYRPQAGRVFLVGDAAGLTDPLFGEGIYNAVRSGQLAAAAIDQHDRDPVEAARGYDAGLEELRRDLRSCEASTRWLERVPSLYLAAATLPWLGGLLMKGFEKGMTWSETKRALWRLPFLDRDKASRSQPLPKRPGRPTDVP